MTPPPPFGCGCSPLCDACVDEGYTRLRGVAQRRGEAWAESLSRVIPMDRRWPTTTTERIVAIAIRKIGDLTADERLRELLAADVIVGARRWWDRAIEQAG